MKYVSANVLTYDANIGRIEPGGRYYVEDDKAERWINGGIATLTETPPPAPPAPPAPDPEPIPPPPSESDPVSVPEEGEGEEAEEERDDSGDEASPSPDEAQQARSLFASGLSERAISQQLGISRTKVHALLAR